MGCDLCGYEGMTGEALVEGTVLTVCKKCSNFGDVIPLTKTKPDIKKPTKIIVEEPKDFIVTNYSERIKKGREQLGLKQRDLAEKTNERESVIHNLESGHLKPSFTLAKKLEKTLNVKLMETYEEPNKVEIDLKNNNLTIGDLIKIKKKTP